MAYYAPETPHVCPDCGGPSLMFKGDVHRWRCRSCLADYLDTSEARGRARAAAEVARQLRKNAAKSTAPEKVSA